MKTLKVYCLTSFSFVMPLILMIGLWSSPYAVAEEPSSWAITVGVGTDFPLNVGAYATLKTPSPFRASFGMGTFPEPYLDFINNAVIPLFVPEEDYSDEDGQVVKEALKNSIVMRLHVGWQWTEHFYTELGYGLVGLGGGVSGRDVLVLLTQYSPERSQAPMRTQSTPLSYTIDSTLHMFDLELGWEWSQWTPVSIRTAIGLAWTVTSQTSVSANVSTQPSRIEKANDNLESFAEEYLDDLFTSYVITPTFSLSVGYQL